MVWESLQISNKKVELILPLNQSRSLHDGSIPCSKTSVCQTRRTWETWCHWTSEWRNTLGLAISSCIKMEWRSAYLRRYASGQHCRYPSKVSRSSLHSSLTKACFDTNAWCLAFLLQLRFITTQSNKYYRGYQASKTFRMTSLYLEKTKWNMTPFCTKYLPDSKSDSWP